MKIITDTEVCVGAGQCVLAAEDLFDQDEDGIVVVLDHEPVGEQQSLARRASSLCPAGAITVQD